MQTIGHYQITGEIARGGMGVVYRARDATLGRDVAIKLLLDAAKSDPSRRERALREARALGKLCHPNVVEVHDAGVHEGCAYMVMDLVEGETLEERLARGELPEDQAAEIVMKTARALAHAHAHGILHRDVKPANVLLRGDEPLLTDFGLAKDLEASLTQLSETGSLMGTPGFWPPEQARGQLDRIGPRSDVYGAGALLYSLLTREPPIKGASLFEVIVATTERPPTPPSRLRPGLSAGLEAVCLKCLEKDPGDRYASAEALARDLDRFLCGEPPLALKAEGRSLGSSSLALACSLALGLIVFLATGRGDGGGATTAPSGAPAESTSEFDAGVALEPEPSSEGGSLTASTSPRTESFAPGTSEWKTLRLATASTEDVEPDRSLGDVVSDKRRQRALSLATSATGLSFVRAWSMAKAVFDEALTLDPDCVPALVGRAKLHRRDREVKVALASLQRAIEVNPDHAEAQFELALTLAEYAGQAERALPHFDRALELQPQYGVAYRRRGDARQSLGDLEGAAFDYELAIRYLILNPKQRAKVQRALKELKARRGT